MELLSAIDLSQILDSTVSNANDTSLGITGVVVLVFSAILGMIKGFIRVLLGLAGLVAAIFGFIFGMGKSEALTSAFISDPGPLVPIAVGGAFAAVAYLVVRPGLGLIMQPIIGSVDLLKDKKIVGALVGLGLGGAGLYGGGSASHQLDAMSFVNEQRKGDEVGVLNKLLASSQESKFGIFQQNTDPFKTAYKCDLVKVVSMAMYDGEGADSEEIQTIINQPDFKKLLRDPKLRKAIVDTNMGKAFSSDALKDYLSNDENRETIANIDWRNLLASKGDDEESESEGESPDGAAVEEAEEPQGIGSKVLGGFSNAVKKIGER